MTDKVSAQRRPFDFEDYIDVLRRNVRWLIGPAFLGLVLATVLAYMMDDTFVSRALIRIVPQQVPEKPGANRGKPAACRSHQRDGGND